MGRINKGAGPHHHPEERGKGRQLKGFLLFFKPSSLLYALVHRALPEYSGASESPRPLLRGRRRVACLSAEARAGLLFRGVEERCGATRG